MSNKHGYNARERRLVINAVAGTAYTILKVIKHTRSMDWDTMYRTCIEAICLSADALVGDAGGSPEIINRLAGAMSGGVTSAKPMSIKTEAALNVTPGAILNAHNN